MTKIPEHLINKNTTTSDFLQELRSQAERLVIPQAMESLSKLTMDDIARLVHELETHQIELEMQNKELLLTQQAMLEINDEYTHLYNDAPIGLLSIDRKGHVLKSNSLAEHMLKHMAKYDPLTDLTNRAYTSEEAYSIISRAKSSGEKVGLMILNVDNLQMINQSAGYLLGDAAIEQTSLIIKESIRDSHFVGRWGCTSFLILLPQCELLDDVKITAATILEKAKIRHDPLELNVLKLSIGLAQFPDHAPTTSKLISLAESAMYKAIAVGGNQYVSTD